MEEENYFCFPIGRWYQTCPINPLSVVTFLIIRELHVNYPRKNYSPFCCTQDEDGHQIIYGNEGECMSR